MTTPPRTTPASDRVRGRTVAAGAGDALRQTLTPDGDGLSTEGRRNLSEMLDEDAEAEERQRRYVRFSPEARELWRWVDTPENISAFKEVIQQQKDRRYWRVFWQRIWKLAVLIVPIVFAWGAGFFEKVLPLIQKVLKLLQAPPS